MAWATSTWRSRWTFSGASRPQPWSRPIVGDLPSSFTKQGADHTSRTRVPSSKYAADGKPVPGPRRTLIVLPGTREVQPEVGAGLHDPAGGIR